MGFSSCSFQALEHRLDSCGSLAQLLQGIWDLPGPEIEPLLAGRFFTTEPPGKASPCSDTRIIVARFFFFTVTTHFEGKFYEF